MLIYIKCLASCGVGRENGARVKRGTKMKQATWLLLAVWCWGHGFAAEVQEEDAVLLAELMQVMAEGTELATKSRMNADFVPGIVTVLQGRELEALGIHTVWEALGLVPGIHPTRKGIGEPILEVRGIGFPFSSGNIKVLVNSVSMNRETTGNHSNVLLMPISQVDRIEVVRGPASVLYGDFAFMGVVNIITRRGEQGATFSLTDTGNYEAQVRHTARPTVGTQPLQWDLNLALRQGTADADRQLPDPEEQYLTGIMALNWGGWQFHWQSVMWELETDGPHGGDDSHHALDLRYQFEPTPTTELQFRVSLNQDDTTVADTVGGSVQQGARRAIQSDTQEASLQWRWQASPRHTWLLGASYTREQTADGALFPLPVPGLPGLQEIRFPANNRNYSSLTVQDYFNMSDALTLTLGLRYDYRDDLDQARLTPRLAAVWNLAAGHTLKAQYAEGFRAPTFFELLTPDGRQRDLELETVGTTELSYIYRQTDWVGRVTLFDSRLGDMVFIRAGDFGNVARGQAQGIELEWEQQVTSEFKWQAHVAYVDSKTSRNRAGTLEPEASNSDWLASVAVWIKPDPHWLLTGRLAYASAIDDPTADVPDQTTLDITANVFDIGGYKGLTLRAGIKNLFDEDIHYPLALPTNTLVFAFPGRTAWLQLAWDW